MTKAIRTQVIYSVEGKNESEISPIWQILQMFFYACCILLGVFICWIFTQVSIISQHNRECVLHGEVSLTNRSFGVVRGKNVSCSIEILQVINHWNHCDIILSIAIVTTTMAAFLGVMFAYCGRGGQGKPGMPDAWRIVVPTIIANSILFSAVLYSAVDFTSGMRSFKHSLKDHWELNVDNFDLAEADCVEINGHVVGEKLSAGLYLLKELMYLWLMFWLMNLLWILTRCLLNVDFQLVRTTIYEFRRLNLVPRPVGLLHPPVTDVEPPEERKKTVKFRLEEREKSVESRPVELKKSVKFRPEERGQSVESRPEEPKKSVKFRPVESGDIFHPSR